MSVEYKTNTSEFSWKKDSSINHPRVEFNEGDSDEAKLYKKILRIAESINHCGDYGHVYWNAEKKALWWVAGDGDGVIEEGHDTMDMIREKFTTIDGIKEIIIEAESSPSNEDEGWVSIDAEITPVVSNLESLSWATPSTTIIKATVGFSISKDDPRTDDDLLTEFTDDISGELLDQLMIKMEKLYVVETTEESLNLPKMISVVGVEAIVREALEGINGMTPDIMEDIWRQRQVVKSDDPNISMFGIDKDSSLKNLSWKIEQVYRIQVEEEFDLEQFGPVVDEAIENMTPEVIVNGWKDIQDDVLTPGIKVPSNGATFEGMRGGKFRRGTTYKPSEGIVAEWLITLIGAEDELLAFLYNLGIPQGDIDLFWEGRELVES